MYKCWFLLLVFFTQLNCSFAEDLNTKTPKSIILTIPKSGTHLIHAAAALITNKAVRQIGREWIDFDSINLDANYVDIYHLHPEFCALQQELVENAKIIILIRDPRDVLISQVFWIEKYFYKPHHCSYEEFIGLSFQDRIQLMMLDPIDQSKPYSHPYVIPYFVYEAELWIKNPNVLICRFEDLVGPKGGGNRHRQIEAIRQLSSFMGYDLDLTRIEYIADNIFGVNEVLGEGNFRSGQIGSWKEFFGPLEKKLFKEHMGQALIDMGYEHSNNW